MSVLRRSFHVGRIVASWTLFTVVFALAVSVTAPHLFGYKSLTVMSGSMEPAVGTGDVILTKPVSPGELRVGDIVTFQDPDGDALITHRVRSLRLGEDRVNVVTKGDANNHTEEWSVAVDGRVGRVVYRVWKLGYLLSWARFRVGGVSLVVIPALLIGMIELWRIWFVKRDDGSLDDEELAGATAY